MKAFRALTLNRVRASVRDRTALIFTLGLAVLFMVIFGLLFGGSGVSLTLDAVNNDHTACVSRLPRGASLGPRRQPST